MKKTNEQLIAELTAAWKQAIEKTDNQDGVVYRVYLDHDFDFRVLYTSTREATYCVVSPDDYGVTSVDDVDDVVAENFEEIMSGLEQVDEN
jgi:lipid II:glycine glycyltransferase (peptidoglycan interpeptide bridge formation enzyme)